MMRLKKRYMYRLKIFILLITAMLMLMISKDFIWSYQNKYANVANQKIITSKYFELENLLKLQKYMKANDVTKDIFSILTNTSRGSDIYSDKIVNFSCKHLEILDVYWLKNSANNFGFSIQAQKWFEDENFDRLTEKLGWNSDNQQNLPLGYFPKNIIIGSDIQMSRFFSRLKECNILSAIKDE